jgi:hypothetical protein
MNLIGDNELSPNGEAFKTNHLCMDTADKTEF